MGFAREINRLGNRLRFLGEMDEKTGPGEIDTKTGPGEMTLPVTPSLKCIAESR